MRQPFHTRNCLFHLFHLVFSYLSLLLAFYSSSFCFYLSIFQYIDFFFFQQHVDISGFHCIWNILNWSWSEGNKSYSGHYAIIQTFYRYNFHSHFFSIGYYSACLKGQNKYIGSENLLA